MWHDSAAYLQEECIARVRYHLEKSGHHHGLAAEEIERMLELATEESLFDVEAPSATLSLAVSANLSLVGVSVWGVCVSVCLCVCLCDGIVCGVCLCVMGWCGECVGLAVIRS